MDPTVAAALAQAAGSLAGGIAQQYFGQSAADQAWKRQKKVLQNQVQWRVADATAAGLHPLAALGLSPAAGPMAAEVGGVGAALSDMGQNVGRAVSAYMNPQEKAVAATLQTQQILNNDLQNELLKTQIASQKATLSQAGNPPGSMDVPFVNDKLRVKYPNLGQDAENHFGESGDWIFGAGNLLESLATDPNFMKRFNEVASYGPFSERFASFARGENPIDLRPLFDYFGWEY